MQKNTTVELLNKAIEIAVTAHKNQTDKNGHAYYGHIFRVMNMGKTLDEKICGVLHDLIEDTEWTFEQLEHEGFPIHIIEALKCLTKKDDNEDYEAFINRVIPNKLAVSVKLNDLTDNMDIKRLSHLTEKDLARLNKYLKAYKLLTE